MLAHHRNECKINCPRFFHHCNNFGIDYALRHDKLYSTVEKNGCLAVKPKSIKLTYAETVRLKDTVEAQNHLIANGYDPTNVFTTNDLFTDDEVKVDIKTK